MIVSPEDLDLILGEITDAVESCAQTPSARTISEETGVELARTFAGIKQLEESGRITIEEPSRHRRVYRVPSMPGRATTAQPIFPGGSGGGVQAVEDLEVANGRFVAALMRFFEKRKLALACKS